VGDGIVSIMDNNPKFKFTSNPHASLNGTSFHNIELRAPIERLVELFGEPITGCDSKTKHEWILEGSDGSVVSLYDYKYDGAREGYWHVGGRTVGACRTFVLWFCDQG
jgi:hypothetical protein